MIRARIGAACSGSRNAMLLRFGCENFRSFKDYQELSLVASTLKDSGPSLFEPDGSRHSVLPAAIIYGANASGKSNVLIALRTMVSLIGTSHTRLSPDDQIPYTPFALDLDYRKRVTKFDCDFIVDGVRFHYGFEFDSNRIHEEWLYTYDGAYRRQLYYRIGQSFTFGKHLRGQNRVTAEITRSNSLFLSAAVQNNHEQLKPVYDFFRSFQFNMEPDQSRLLRYYEKKAERRDKVLKFLREADTGVCGAKLDYSDPRPEAKEIIGELTDFFRKKFPHHQDIFSGEVAKQPNLKLSHVCINDDPVFLPLSDESRGTLRALELAFDVYDSLETGSVLVVDELEASLHTLLASAIVELFSKESSNPQQGQLIATTHDTNLLCSKNLRRDQIWFTEKDGGGQTHLYPLTAIRTRNTDNLEKGYLQGRFGAVPFFGTIANLFGSEAA